MESFSQNIREKDFLTYKMLKNLTLILSFFFISTSLCLASDIREFEIGSKVKKIPNQRYNNIKCLEDNKKIKYWKNYKRCKKNEDGLFYVNFEYNDKYAFNENFEGTQVAGHPVIISIGINSSGILSRINLKTDPSAPFYFKKQAHLFWLRIYSKYGSNNWTCKHFEKKETHLIINKKYVNKSCYKVYKNKKITYQTEFYFIGDREKENLISRTQMSVSEIIS